jgi:hypothetical protein
MTEWILIFLELGIRRSLKEFPSRPPYPPLGRPFAAKWCAINTHQQQSFSQSFHSYSTSIWILVRSVDATQTSPEIAHARPGALQRQRLPLAPMTFAGTARPRLTTSGDQVQPSDRTASRPTWLMMNAEAVATRNILIISSGSAERWGYKTL